MPDASRQPAAHPNSRARASGQGGDRIFRVHINLPVLRANLSREDNVTLSDNEVRQWLLAAGFTPAEGYWTVLERDLGQLSPDEVLSAEPVEPRSQ